MENHIFKHWNENSENPKPLFEMIEDLANIRLSTLNNEEELTHLNNEDNRLLNGERFITASEIGLDLNSDKATHCGECIRQLYMKIHNFQKDKPKTYQDIFEIEKNYETKNRFINLFRMADLIRQEKVELSKTIRGLRIRQRFDFIYIDPLKDEEKSVLMKPVNDSAIFVRDLLFDKNKQPRPMTNNIPELFVTGYMLGKPFYIQYVGKVYSKFIEMKIERKDDYILVDDTLVIKVDIKSVANYINQFIDCMRHSWIPSMSYKSQITEEDNLNFLEENGIISWMIKKEIYNKGFKQTWACETCAYEKTCAALENPDVITEPSGFKGVEFDETKREY